jgi:RNA polymerase sigma-70 factor (ECF subfamily)
MTQVMELHAINHKLDIFKVTMEMGQGSEDAFNLFYSHYFDRLYQYVLVITHGDEDLTRDVMQDTMVRVIRYIKPFQEEKIFWNWLTKIARTAFIDSLRRWKKKDEKTVPILDDEDYVWVSQHSHDEILLTSLNEVFLMLPEDERFLISDCYLHGKTHETMGQELGITAKAVESRLARIRAKMRTMILKRLAHEETL